MCVLAGLRLWCTGGVLDRDVSDGKIMTIMILLMLLLLLLLLLLLITIFDFV